MPLLTAEKVVVVFFAYSSPNSRGVLPMDSVGPKCLSFTFFSWLAGIHLTYVCTESNLGDFIHHGGYAVS